MAENKAAFLDRDGTLNQDTGYAHDPEELIWLPGALDALVALKQRGYLLIVLTNQSGVARGYFPEADVVRFHGAMQAQLRRHGGIEFDGLYYCPHHPEAAIERYRVDCACRKPRCGLFERAVREHILDPALSLAVGDKPRDLTPAQKVGVRRLFLMNPGTFDGNCVDAAFQRVACWPEILRRLS